LASSEGTLTFGALNTQILAEDPRLSSRNIKLVKLRLPVAELMEEFAAQTGVLFEARDNAWDDSGRWRVMCCLRDAVSVADAMEAVRSALSQKGATWSWRRTGVAPDYTYRLLRPANYEKLMEANRDEVHSFFRKEYEQAKRSFGMTPEQLKEAARSDDTGIFGVIGRQEHTREGLQSFATSLSPEQQNKVLSGGRVEIDLANANDITRTFAANRLAEMEKWSHTSMSAQSTVTFAFEQMSIKHSPSLFITFDTFGGYAYLGGVPTERKWQARFAAEAMVEGDAAKPTDTDILDKKFLPPTKKDKPSDDGDEHPEQVIERELRATYDAEGCFARIANAESPRINFVACLAQKNIINSSMSPVYGQTVRDVIEEMGKRSIVAKWRRGILLFRYTAGFANDDNIVDVTPYPLYRMLRNRLDTYGTQKYIPLTDLCEMTRLATPRQINTAYEEYPAPFDFLKGYCIARAYDVLQALSRQPELLERMNSEQGVAVGELTPTLRKVLKMPAETPPATRLLFRQMVKQTHLSPPPLGVVGTWFLRGGNATDQAIFEFAYPVPQTWKSVSEVRRAKLKVRQEQEDRRRQQRITQ
jgi:hypothetical protein